MPETNNYFVQAPFILNRHTLDTKVNWNASEKLNFFGRYSVLDFVTENGTNFGKELQGQPLGSSNPGRGEGNTYNFSLGSTYTLSPTMVMDAHVGFVRMNSGVAQSDLAEFKGRDVLGLPGTNGPNFYEGGTPLFDLDTYGDLGTTDTFMPYFRSDDQLQFVLNLGWTRGATTSGWAPTSTIRRSTTRSPRSAGATVRGARRVQVPVRTDTAPGRAERQFLQRLRRIPARRAEPDRAAGARRALYDTQLAVQPLRARPVAADLEDHPLAGYPVGILPGAAPRRPGSRALRRQHEHDDDRRRRLGTDGSRRVGEQDHVRPQARLHVPHHRTERGVAPGSGSPTIPTRSRVRCGRITRPCST